MSEESNSGYGFNDDNSAFDGMSFGLNPAAAYLKKFEFTDKGGKDGADQEALDIIFSIGGKDVSFRQFPVTRAYDENNQEVTDVNHPKMKEAISVFNAIIVHILHAFVDKNDIKTALSVPIRSFKEFCTVARGVLPANFEMIPLDIFLQWQWQISGSNDRTYLRIPKNMKHGKWLCKAVTPIGGSWEKDETGGKLAYFSKNGDQVQKHPFDRSAWFMSSNFAHQLKEESIEAYVPQNNTDPTDNNTDKGSW